MTANVSGIAAARELAVQKYLTTTKVYNMQNSSEKHVSTGGSNTVLPAVFSSVEEAIKLLKLDRRRKWFEWEGTVVYNMWYTAPKSCTGCDGGGCQECGYTGNRKSCVPVPAFMPDGSIVKVCPSNGR